MHPALIISVFLLDFLGREGFVAETLSHGLLLDLAEQTLLYRLQELVRSVVKGLQFQPIVDQIDENNTGKPAAFF